jgi:N-methylhydantoinase B
LCDGGVILARGLDRMRFPPWGVAGGRPGARVEVTVNRGRADARRLGKIHQLHMRKGDTVTVDLAGGGGFGDPFGRDPALVLADVVQGFVTIAGAARDYGVAIVDGGIDVAATAAMRAHRVAPAAWFDFGPDRAAWETVFDDAAMAELNCHLYTLPKAVRQDARRTLFEAVVPGITVSEGRSLIELIPDPEAARLRLRRALGALTAGGGGP